MSNITDCQLKVPLVKLEEANQKIAKLEATIKSITEQRDSAWLVAEHREKNVEYEKKLEDRWNYIKTDMDGARSLLLLLKDGKGTSTDFDTMVDRIIESRKQALKEES